MNLESLRDDALTALELLETTTGATNAAFIGCRLGGFIAASAAASREAAPVALWEPVLKPAAYLRDAIRARLIGDMTGASQARLSAAELNEQLLKEGSLDIYGYPIHLGLVQSLEGKELRAELGKTNRPILLVQISSQSDLRSDYARFSEELSSHGASVSVHRLSGTVGWWFRGAGRDRDQPDVLTNETVATTVDWLVSQFDTADVAQ
jgi:acetyl esterase/lipase